MASIPRANAPISNNDGSPTREWYNYLRANLSPSDLTTVEGEITVIAEKLGSPDGTVQNIPPISVGGTIVAQQSVAAVGAFPGAVILNLVNDQASPGNTYFYGTSPTGSKGWVSLTTALGQASIGNLGDVDTTTTAPTDGQVLTWVNADSKWEPKTPTGGGGGGDQFAVASGTDTITATFPTTPTLADGLQFKVRAAGANTTTAPTFNPNGLGALTLYKLGGIALAAGDISGAGHELIIRYRASPARYELVNPTAIQTVTGTGVNNADPHNPIVNVPGSASLVGSAKVIGSAATSMTVSGLNLAADICYRVVFSIANATGSGRDIGLFYNGDTTTSHYAYNQIIGGTVPAASRNTSSSNVAGISGGTSNSVTGEILVTVDPIGNVRATSTTNRDVASGIYYQAFAQTWASSGANVTSLALTASASGVMAVGSYMNVYRY